MSERDYPTEEELKVIEAWPANSTDSIRTLLAFVKERWNWPDWGWHQDGSRLLISTGGWSGNEDLIGALQDNFMFWALCWKSVRRGGHYEFEVPELHKDQAGDSTRMTATEVLSWKKKTPEETP